MFCLTCATDPSWAEGAVDALDEILVDHAHCEMKAATMAMSLAGRLHDRPTVVRRLVELAKEELDHFDRVLDALETRGLALGTPPVDAYAAQLRKQASATVRGAHGFFGPIDKLCVGAIIEARSCERFKLLATALAERGHTEEADFYRELMASEAKHYTLLRGLAIEATGDEARVDARLAELARLEGEIIASLGGGATIHG